MTEQQHSDDFVIVRHYVWWNFVAHSALITRESLSLEDVVALINDVGRDFRNGNKRGYTEIPQLETEVVE